MSAKKPKNSDYFVEDLYGLSKKKVPKTMKVRDLREKMQQIDPTDIRDTAEVFLMVGDDLFPVADVRVEDGPKRQRRLVVLLSANECEGKTLHVKEPESEEMG
jgi:hypothetical protein